MKKPSLRIYLRADDPLRRALDKARRRFGMSASEVARRGLVMILRRLGVLVVK